MTLSPGDVLHARYRIVRQMGQGGFGTMYRVWDTALGRPCALKENLDRAPEIERQFLREAKILANLHHPGLPRVTDYFIEGQQQYLVMDYIEGQDLQEMLEDWGGPLPEDQALAWARQVCDALDYLHTQQPPVIHRDIKPANIKITPSGQAMLVDFGIAKIYDPQSKTTLGAQAVTPGYSPHEQYGQGVTDARTDVYALGATLYTLLTGVEPPESIQRVVRDPLTLPRSLNPAISLRTSAALVKALQVDASQRFQGAADFKAALAPPSPPLRAAALRPAPAAAYAAAYSPAPPAAGLAVARPPWGWIAAVGGLALLVLVLLGAILRQQAGRPAALLVSASPPPDRPTASEVQAAPAAVSPSGLASPETAAPGVAASSTDVPATSAPTVTPSATPRLMVYTVRAGDTCDGIARKFGTSIQALMGFNKLSGGCNLLYAGQPLYVPDPAARSAAVSPSPTRPPVTQVASRDGMVQIYIPSGEFLMGSTPDDLSAGDEQKPQHTVHLQAYWIDRSEVTNAMYALCVEAGACQPPEEVRSKTHPAYYDEPEFADYPVIFVSWHAAEAYCQWAGRRLPSEAEWEKAARGGDGRPYPWGDAPPDAGRANFNGQVGDSMPVDSYPNGASPYGVLDMAGNVAEWVADWYSAAYYKLTSYTNPPGPQTGEFRVLRGGSWFSSDRSMRAAFRLWNYPDVYSDTIGFRCAR